MTSDPFRDKVKSELELRALHRHPERDRRRQTGGQPGQTCPRIHRSRPVCLDRDERFVRQMRRVTEG